MNIKKVSPQILEIKKMKQLNLFDKLLLTEPYNIEIMYQKANPLNQLKKQEVAQQIYIDIIKINPKHELSFLKIGDILKDQQSYQQAQQYYEKCIQINANNSAAQFGIGECLRATYQYHHALHLSKNLQFHLFKLHRVNNLNQLYHFIDAAKTFTFLFYKLRFPILLQMYLSRSFIFPHSLINEIQI
ncbi:unnamed protein product (macronuclear) [Paramecium tetraurelia]|uniref:Uncharacterized protein n=1 Tax=Paramecium tetraurelia TaxID=5888 RepID=A0DMM9_PARTE|nr:uncharacterized protein GSPATT00039678001 [Paramecium tetraurelia]CAK84296.1 unnamed protein product [Paramecium tetraurelia]|eukprot:XP_001451693.1 hypothetical protein (macronuclear) [Paramecium tetraurelia strain d4-2]